MILLFSRQGRVRLRKLFTPMPERQVAQLSKDVMTRVLARRAVHCNILEANDRKIVYRRFASLFVAMCIDDDDNELVALEVIQRYVEVLDLYFGNVCELDIIFHFDRAYYLLDELFLGGELQEQSRRAIMAAQRAIDSVELQEQFA